MGYIMSAAWFLREVIALRPFIALFPFVSMAEPSVAPEVIAFCISLGQLASSRLNIWPDFKDYTMWQIIKVSGSPSRTLYYRFIIRVLRVFLTAAILALKCSQSNPRAVTVITNAVTLIESIFEVFSTPNNEAVTLNLRDAGFPILVD
jgi:hypothetical protein